MSKLYTCIIICISILLSFSCSRGDGTVIRGEISNLNNPYILSTYLSSDTLVIDTIQVNNSGNFTYNVDIDSLTTFTLYMNNYESAAVVFADRGQNVKVIGDANLPDLIRVSGNEINDDLTLFKSQNQDLLKQRGQLLVNFNTNRDSDTSQVNALDRNDDLANLNLLNHELTLKAEEFIKENPTKLSSLILISNFFMNSDTPQALERVLGYIQGDVKETRIANRLYTYSEKVNRSAEGAILPYFQLKDYEGDTIQSYDYNGKYLLLSFVSSSGIESRETIDLLKNEYEQLDSSRVEFVSVYIDSDIYPIDYPEHDSITWTIVPEKRSWGSDIVDLLNVQYIPFNILVRPDGTIMERNVPSQEVAEVIRKSIDN
ncbi:MAG: DUF4369 domain-containing protein [Fermentimonas sp.]|nr:DUF4369 domain-containing protein [Fermentimonas sp.]